MDFRTSRRREYDVISDYFIVINFTNWWENHLDIVKEVYLMESLCKIY